MGDQRLFNRLLTTTVLIITAASFSTGCLDKKSDVEDGGPGEDSTVYNDGGVDARPDSTPATCDMADLVEQLACDTGQRCTLLSTTEIGCLATGTSAPYSSCVSTTLPDDYCGIGTVCSDANEPGDPACLPFCLEKLAPCAQGGFCTQESGYSGVMLCNQPYPCEPVGTVGSPTCLGSGAGCYFAQNGHTFCIPNGGTKQLGEACVDLECATGLICMGPPTEELCEVLCDPADPVCPAGTYCDFMQLGTYGYCH